MVSASVPGAMAAGKVVWVGSEPSAVGSKEEAAGRLEGEGASLECGRLGAEGRGREAWEFSKGGDEGGRIKEEGVCERADAAQVVEGEGEKVDAAGIELGRREVAEFGLNARQVCFGGKRSCIRGGCRVKQTGWWGAQIGWSRDGDVQCDEGVGLRRVAREWWRQMEPDVGWTAVGVGRREQAGRFEEDVGAMAHEASEGSEGREDVKDGVADAVVEGCFAEFDAAEEVVAAGVEEGAARAKAASAAEGGWEDREAEFALEQEEEGVVWNAVSFVGAREAEEGEAGEGSEDGGEGALDVWWSRCAERGNGGFFVVVVELTGEAGEGGSSDKRGGRGGGGSRGSGRKEIGDGGG